MIEEDVLVWKFELTIKTIISKLIFFLLGSSYTYKFDVNFFTKNGH